MNAQLIEGDFDHARTKALVRDLWATLTCRSNDLLPYHEVRRRLNPNGETYRGVYAVPIDRIVGSGERHRDFDRAFLPRHSRTKGRWMSIDHAYHEEIRLPPVQLAQIGDVYFVKDGNHRISVARERGVEFIDAEVVEEHVRVPVTVGTTTKELFRQAARADFPLVAADRSRSTSAAGSGDASPGGGFLARLTARGQELGRELSGAAALAGDARPLARSAGSCQSCPH
jgi:hypothetical protein